MTRTATATALAIMATTMTAGLSLAYDIAVVRAPRTASVASTVASEPVCMYVQYVSLVSVGANVLRHYRCPSAKLYCTVGRCVYTCSHCNHMCARTVYKYSTVQGSIYCSTGTVRPGSSASSTTRYPITVRATAYTEREHPRTPITGLVGVGVGFQA